MISETGGKLDEGILELFLDYVHFPGSFIRLGISLFAPVVTPGGDSKTPCNNFKPEIVSSISKVTFLKKILTFSAMFHTRRYLYDFYG